MVGWDISPGLKVLNKWFLFCEFSILIIINPENLLFFRLKTVGTPPPDATWHTFSSGLAPSGSPWCHVAHISIRISSIRISPKEDTWHASPIRTSSGRSTRHSQTSHPDDRYITSGRPTYPIQICLSRSLTKVSKSCYAILTACHGPRSATCRVKGQEWQQVTSHNLWHLRRPPRSLAAARRVMMALSPLRGIMSSQNISLSLKRETELLRRYIWTFT